MGKCLSRACSIAACLSVIFRDSRCHLSDLQMTGLILCAGNEVGSFGRDTGAFTRAGVLPREGDATAVGHLEGVFDKDLDVAGFAFDFPGFEIVLGSIRIDFTNEGAKLWLDFAAFSSNAFVSCLLDF